MTLQADVGRISDRGRPTTRTVERLFELIEELVKWENINDERILGQARKEILKSTDGNPPPVLDPFCGGGSIPLEAQRPWTRRHMPATSTPSLC